MDISKRKVDSAAIEQGGWVGKKHGSPLDGWGDLCLRVRGIDSTDFKAFQNREIAAVDANGRDDEGRIKPDVQAQITARTLLEVILIDWDHLTEDDKPLPYSQEQAKEFLTNPDYREFRDAVMQASVMVGRVRAKATEADAKN